MKVVINSDWGGFGLSDKATEMYAKLKNIKLYKRLGRLYGAEYSTIPWPEYDQLDTNQQYEAYFTTYNLPRDDLDLITVVEVLGQEANGWCSSLKIVEIPDDIEWVIQEQDGMEWVAEKHRTWS